MNPETTEAIRILAALAERLADDTTDYSPQVDQIIRIIGTLAAKG
jgi:hypothetical protein